MHRRTFQQRQLHHQTLLIGIGDLRGAVGRDGGGSGGERRAARVRRRRRLLRRTLALHTGAGEERETESSGDVRDALRALGGRLIRDEIEARVKRRGLRYSERRDGATRFALSGGEHRARGRAHGRPGVDHRRRRPAAASEREPGGAGTGASCGGGRTGTLRAHCCRGTCARTHPAPRRPDPAAAAHHPPRSIQPPIGLARHITQIYITIT
ncbi:hypothetical protein O3G_MSEX011772 [Manduca sexta]|uniref:Uncharacterized protein n=1 Tax=Manduca sexta TaxID=7130 RepID=A0A921ZLW4_MANSE|nr:hypothetical protein O3G_MSEX011772 [Manduca sexta]